MLVKYYILHTLLKSIDDGHHDDHDHVYNDDDHHDDHDGDDHDHMRSRFCDTVLSAIASQSMFCLEAGLQ